MRYRTDFRSPIGDQVPLKGRSLILNLARAIREDTKSSKYLVHDVEKDLKYIRRSTYPPSSVYVSQEGQLGERLLLKSWLDFKFDKTLEEYL